MMRQGMLIGLLAFFTLSACTVQGPPKDEIIAYLQGVYLQDVTITQRSQCELTPSMEAEGHTNVWLVRYRFGNLKKVYGELFTEKESGWQPYLAIDFCPER